MKEILFTLIIYPNHGFLQFFRRHGPQIKIEKMYILRMVAPVASDSSFALHVFMTGYIYIVEFVFVSKGRPFYLVRTQNQWEHSSDCTRLN